MSIFCCSSSTGNRENASEEGGVGVESEGIGWKEGICCEKEGGIREGDGGCEFRRGERTLMSLTDNLFTNSI